MSSRLKKIGINLSLVLASCVIGYLLAEIIFFRVILTNWPPPMRTYLPRIADIIAQNTKSGAIPHDYIAILV
jgi:hypothetical protein